MIYVANKHTMKPGAPREQVYVGRPSILGNPFVIGEHCKTRETAIELFSVWLKEAVEHNKAVRKELERLADIAQTGDLTLVCWCVPQACHAWVIEKQVKRIIEERKKK